MLNLLVSRRTKKYGGMVACERLYTMDIGLLKLIIIKCFYIGRKPAASPATGYAKRHVAQQKEIIEKVFN